MRRISLLITIGLLTLCSSSSFSQSAASHDFDKVSQSKWGADFMVFPTYFLNSASVGLNYHWTPRLENTLIFGARYMPRPEAFNIHVSLNTNFYSKNGKNYLPVWLRFSNSRSDMLNGDGDRWPHTVRLSLGTGYGRMIKIAPKLSLRCEVGIGASLYYDNDNGMRGDVFPYKFDWKDYKYQYVFPATKIKVTFVRKFKA